MNTPFGQSMLPMLQPHLQDRLGNATATGFEVPSTSSAEPTQASIADAIDSVSHSHVAHDLQQLQKESKDAHGASNGVASGRQAAPGAAPAAAASASGGTKGSAGEGKIPFQQALRAEFDKLRTAGQADANAAAAEAMQAVMTMVHTGLVEAPPRAAA